MPEENSGSEDKRVSVARRRHSHSISHDLERAASAHRHHGTDEGDEEAGHSGRHHFSRSTRDLHHASFKGIRRNLQKTSFSSSWSRLMRFEHPASWISLLLSGFLLRIVLLRPGGRLGYLILGIALLSAAFGLVMGDLKHRILHTGVLLLWLLAEVSLGFGWIAFPEHVQQAVQSNEPENNHTITVVLAANNEHRFLERTLESIQQSTPPEWLKEIIIVDDASEPPLWRSFNRSRHPLVWYVRNSVRQGLIRSKRIGADAARAQVIIFLDAHVKPMPGWATPLIHHIDLNYKRVVVPAILQLNGTTWEVSGTEHGYKMMFDWALNFQWFDDGNDMVPCMSGGLLAISKRWWAESGRLDNGMVEWGGENIEQSVRVWCCGGEIVVARDSHVAHVFRHKNSESVPYNVNETHVAMNKVRAVEMWFDEYKEEHYREVPGSRGLSADISERDRAEREALKRRLGCQPFQWYVDKFEHVFRERGMQPWDTFLLQAADASAPGGPWCAAPAWSDAAHPLVSDAMAGVRCNASSRSQRWAWRETAPGAWTLFHADPHNPLPRCVDAGSPRHPRPSRTSTPAVARVHLCAGAKRNQHWTLRPDGRLQHTTAVGAKWCLQGGAASPRPPLLALVACGDADGADAGEVFLETAPLRERVAIF